jgi:class 3 adenylate cyclase
MIEQGDLTTHSQQLAMLYADIAGSTALYEEHGDVIARNVTAICVEVMSEVVMKFKGRIVKTIGDEIMAVFHDPSRCFMASTDMHGAVRRASASGRFETGALRIKVGAHYGHGIEEASDVYGEAAIVAQQIIKLAKADQTLISAALLESVPEMLRMGSRFFDRIDAEHSGKPIKVHELVWEVSDSTQVSAAHLVPATPEDTTLELDYMGDIYRLDVDHPHVRLGRVAGVDVVIPTDLTSRQHAEIEYKRGRFHLRDNSVNGTVLINEEGAKISLRRESVVLRGRGSICLGGAPEDNPQGVLKFRCE